MVVLLRLKRANRDGSPVLAGQRDAHDAADVRVRDLDAPTVQVDRPADDREAQPGSAGRPLTRQRRAVPAHEPLEHVGPLVACDARSVVEPALELTATRRVIE